LKKLECFRAADDWERRTHASTATSLKNAEAGTGQASPAHVFQTKFNRLADIRERLIDGIALRQATHNIGALGDELAALAVTENDGIDASRHESTFLAIGMKLSVDAPPRQRTSVETWTR
jgi:hypothetical protein